MSLDSSTLPGTGPAAAAGSLSVLVMNSFYAPFVVGGAEVVAESLATELAVQGHRVSVVTSCSREQEPGVEQMSGVDVHRFFPKNLWWLHDRFTVGDRRSVVDKLRWRITDAWNRDAGEHFGRILDTVQPDIVHTHNIKGFSPIVWEIARRRGIPVVHTGHSYELICADGALRGRGGGSCAPQSRCFGCNVHGAWYRAKAEAIDVFCSPSDYLLRVHAEAGVVPKRTARVRNGIARRAPLRPVAAEGRPAVRFLYMGQLASHKGIDTLINAIGATSRADFAVDFAGRGDSEARLKKLAAGDNRVRFHGFVEGVQKERLLSSADVLLFPSVWVENAPMSIAEAFRYGLPVVGSRIGAIPEFVEHDINGLLFEVGNAASLVSCMTRLCQRPDELRRISEGAKRSGESWPTPQDMAHEYVGIYRSLLAEERRQK